MLLILNIALYLFLVIIRPQDLYVPLAQMRIVLISLIIMAIVWVVSPTKKRFILLLQDKYFALYCLAVTASTIQTYYMSYIANVALEAIEWALVYYCIENALNSFRIIRAIIKWVLVLMLTMSLLMIMQYHNVYDITGRGMRWSGLKNVWQIVGVGIFNNPNDLAYTLVFAVPFLIMGILEGTGIWKIVNCVSAGILVYAIFITHSRGGYLAFTLATVVLMILKVENKWVKRSFVVAGLVVALLAVWTQTKGYKEDSSSMGRVESWTAGWNMMKTHPLVGVGRGNYGDNYNLDSHNSFVRAGAELGVLGLYCFVGLLYSAFRELKFNLAQSEQKNLRVCLFAYLVAYIIGSLFSTRTYDIIFFIALAICGATIRTENDHAAQCECNLPLKTKIGLLNKYVIMLTCLTMVVWKYFMIQAF